MRLDSALVARNLSESRNKAQTMIQRGFVFVNGTVITKCHHTTSELDIVTLGDTLPYVSRAGEKLASALSYFNISVVGKICLDIGSSTGGFTDCLLQHGAHKVYAVDVGTDQLHPTLIHNPKVFLSEKTDIRNFVVLEAVDVITIDVSFISLEKIVPLLRTFAKIPCEVILLVKPQFELGKAFLNKRGIIEKHTSLHAISKIQTIVLHEKMEWQGFIESPIVGGDGNTEYLAFIKI